MDEIQEYSSTSQSKLRSSSCFIGCFGSSHKLLCQDLKTASSSKNKKQATSSTSTFSDDKSTVSNILIDSDHVPESHDQSREFCNSLKSDENISQQQINYKQAAGIKRTCHPAVDSGQNYTTQVQKQKVSDKEITQENSDPDHKRISLGKDEKLQKQKRKNKVENFVFRSSETMRVLPHTTSRPPGRNPKKQKAFHRGDDNDSSRGTRKNFDPVVGMLIIVMTLGIMLIWGTLCAILCTFAWLFMVPRLRTQVDSNENVRKGLNLSSTDMDSEEYKKKVVLEGFLQRDHRRVVRIF